MLIVVLLVFAAIVLYALSKNYTIRAGGKTLGTALFFEASRPPSKPVNKISPPGNQAET